MAGAFSSAFSSAFDIAPAAVAPTLSGATIPAAGTTLTATLDKVGCIPASGTGGFTLAGTTATVASWAISGTTLTLTFAGTVLSTATVTYSYDRATTTDDISESTGAAFLANFTGTAVVNNSTQTPPAPLTGAGADSGGMTYHGDRNVLRQRYENQKALALLLTLVTDF